MWTQTGAEWSVDRSLACVHIICRNARRIAPLIGKSSRLKGPGATNEAGLRVVIPDDEWPDTFDMKAPSPI